MAQKTNSFERFWKELKRRKVVHVITVYAAVSFVILQLVDIVEQPLRLPDWTTALVIVLFCIGLIIAVFVSWVYDITPAGVKRTKPISTVKNFDKTTSSTSSRWKIATYVSGAIIIALVAFNFISKRNLNAGISKLEKSIAVLPFINDSGSDSTTYFINGLMEEILNNLQKIKDFRVLSRTSTEQYKGFSIPTVPEIAKKLGVNYIVEGSGQKLGNFYRLRVQLIAAKKEKHLWAESYQKEIKGTQDIFSTQSDIAQSMQILQFFI
jgi:adenylate cyclase